MTAYIDFFSCLDVSGGKTKDACEVKDKSINKAGKKVGISKAVLAKERITRLRTRSKWWKINGCEQETQQRKRTLTRRVVENIERKVKREWNTQRCQQGKKI